MGRQTDGHAGRLSDRHTNRDEMKVLRKISLKLHKLWRKDRQVFFGSKSFVYAKNFLFLQQFLRQPCKHFRFRKNVRKCCTYMLNCFRESYLCISVVQIKSKLWEQPLIFTKIFAKQSFCEKSTEILCPANISQIQFCFTYWWQFLPFLLKPWGKSTIAYFGKKPGEEFSYFRLF
jgi:hypothetical protein